MLLAALRRFALLLVVSLTATVAVSALFGLLVSASIDRAVSLGLYLVGTFLLVAGFFVGNRGPTRVKSETPGSSFLPLPLFGSRRLRWATLGEQEETINNSAVFIVLGLVLVLIGVAIDSRHSIF